MSGHLGFYFILNEANQLRTGGINTWDLEFRGHVYLNFLCGQKERGTY